MHQERLVTGLTVAFAVMTAVLGITAVVYSPALLVLAVVFGAVTYLLYYQASGRLMNRVYRGVERQAATSGDGEAGFGAGPREEWTPPRQEQRRQARRQRARQARQQTRRQRGRQGGQRARQGRGQTRPSAREASQVLGVDPGADESTVRRAYRERIKEVHPDAEGGDEEEFKRVQEAYEVLTD